MIKKIFLGLLLVLFSLVGWFFIATYINYKKDPDTGKNFLKPQLRKLTVTMHEITAKQMVMTLGLVIKHNLPIGFKADSMRYEIYIADTLVMKQTYAHRVHIKAGDTTFIPLPVTFNYKDFANVLKKLENKGEDSVEYKIKTSFYSHSLWKKTFNLTLNKLMPLFHIPEISSGGIQLDSLNFKRAALKANIHFRNRNPFAIVFRSIEFEIEIEGNELIKGKKATPTTIPMQGATDFNIPVIIPFKESRKSLWDLLTKGGKTAYKVKLIYRLKSEKKTLDNIKVTVNLSDTLKSTIDLIKEKRKKK